MDNTPTDEQLVADYVDKIAELEGQLSQHEADKLDELKRKIMLKHYPMDQVERYVQHIAGETSEEITAEVDSLRLEIPPKKNYIDPSPMGAGRRPVANTNARLEQIGRNAYKRLRKAGKL